MENAASLSSPVAATVDNCPKCGRGRKASEKACARCGLLAARFAQHRQAKSEVDPAGMAALWSACLASWDDGAMHDRYLEEARRLEFLPLAARRYRKELMARPDDAVATRRLSQIAFLTETIVRGQVKDPLSPMIMRAARAMSVVMAAAFLFTSTWVAVLVLRR